MLDPINLNIIFTVVFILYSLLETMFIYMCIVEIYAGLYATILLATPP